MTAHEVPDLDDWIAAVAAELGIDGQPTDVAGLLDAAGHVAHNVARPAAPVTAFLIGVAIGRRGGDIGATGRLCDQVAELAGGWREGRDASTQ